MALGRRLIRLFVALLVVFGVLIWGVALLLFSQVAENSDDFANYAIVYVVINAVGVAVLIALIGQRLVRLVRDYHRFVPGSRLQARVVSIVVVVAAIPLVVLYMFSVTFIMRGIDQWFDVDVGEGLDEALELTRIAIDLRESDRLDDLEFVAERLADLDIADRGAALGRYGRELDASALVLLAPGRQVLASWLDDGRTEPIDDLVQEIPQQLPFVGLSLQSDGGAYNEITGAVKIDPAASEDQILVGSFGVPERISQLINSVDGRHQTFGQLGLVRAELKLSFAATLSLVLLVAILAAVYAAFFVAQRLILPIQRLMQGTRAVARGDFDTKVPHSQGDEIGFLVNSFNNMTQRLAVARQEANDSERRLEDERNKLEVILARLSTGVVSLEPDLTIRTANQAAGDILRLDLESHIGESLVDLAESHPLLREFLDATSAHLEHGQKEWRDQITLKSDFGNREIVCACSALPREGEHGEGFILVFDDITVLMQAQKEAAWGEVARRLAHEIKNPLTPIQLSAERVRRRFLEDGKGDTELLDRATHTIIQQVDAMKGMVDAFSEYARAPDIKLGELDLNALIAEVTELYRAQSSPVKIRLQLDSALPPVRADVGRLRQVIHNLMRNASEAVEGQQDALIEIVTRIEDLDGSRYVEILVSDNGPGFAADIIDQAFLPYVTSKTRGTGLGLAIVRKLVEEHGGIIRARNKAQGGAEVSILLPLAGAGRIDRSRAQQRRKHA